MAYTVFGLMSAWEIEVNQAYVELLGQSGDAHYVLLLWWTNA
jgi:hypothetical protein